jgi:hypothetical protein
MFVVVVFFVAVRRIVGQVAPEIAYDLFNYNYNVSGSFKSTSGGVGLKQTWKEQAGTEFGCDVLRFVGNLTKPTNIVYASPQDSVMVGSAYSGSKYCAIARGFAGAPFGTSSGVMYVSVLFMSLFQSVTNKDGAFAVAVGDDATVADWNPEQNNLYISGTAVIAVRAIRHLQTFTIQMSGGGAQQQFTSINPATGPFAVLLVVRYEWSDPKRVIARFFPFDLINGTRDVNDTHVLAAPTSSYTLDTPKLTSISMATYRFHAAQVRVGSTFNSVYADVPSQYGTMQTTPLPSTATNASTATTASNTSTDLNATTTISTILSTTTISTILSTTTATPFFSTRTTKAPATSRQTTPPFSITSSNTSTNTNTTAAVIFIPDTATAESEDNSALVGAIVGGVITLLLLGAVIAFFVLRSRRQTKENDGSALKSSNAPPESNYARIPTSSSNFGEQSVTPLGRSHYGAFHANEL